MRLVQEVIGSILEPLVHVKAGDSQLVALVLLVQRVFWFVPVLLVQELGFALVLLG